MGREPAWECWIFQAILVNAGRLKTQTLQVHQAPACPEMATAGALEHPPTLNAGGTGHVDVGLLVKAGDKTGAYSGYSMDVWKEGGLAQRLLYTWHGHTFVAPGR